LFPACLVACASAGCSTDSGAADVEDRSTAEDVAHGGDDGAVPDSRDLVETLPPDVPADGDADVGEESGPPVEDDARIVSYDFPTVLHQGQTYHASITVANVGLAVWTEADGYRLGTIGDADPFYDNNRVFLEDSVSVVGDPVAPGTVTFNFLLRAYVDPGVYVSDWQMMKESVHWFGEILTLDVQVVEPYDTCIEPIPPPLAEIHVVVHIDSGDRKVLDSTPRVNSREYCTEIGFTDGRSWCPPRPEGHPQVDVCNEYLVGRASDTGRIGPTWSYNGLPCDVTTGADVCVNHSTNQFLCIVYGVGTARACAADGVCGELVIP
jgi:hypothetical protein